VPCTGTEKCAVWAESGSETNFVDKLICASIAKHYDFGGLGTLCATSQSKRSYLKILKV
jgi:hypothetical protein